MATVKLGLGHTKEETARTYLRIDEKVLCDQFDVKHQYQKLRETY